MDEDYEERVLSILRGREGYDEEYSSISEFKEHLNEAGLAEEELEGVGWVMWRENEQQQLHHKIKTLLEYFAPKHFWFGFQSLVQFWGVVKEEGRHHYLSTSHYPFYFDKVLNKGASWYRKICMDREAVEAEQLGGVGRAYRNKQPESTPDLRLYSINEFPLRDEAARCGFRAYMALPLFDLHTHESYGVLETLSDSLSILDHSILDRGLEIAGLRSAHRRKDTLDRNEQPDNEITEILELAIKADPRLSLAQVWIPCKQCPNTSTTLCCMKMASFISGRNKLADMFWYIQACEFHNLQLDFTCFHQNMSDLSISQSPLAHYAKKARLSHCFAFCLQNVNNSNDPFVIIQFFLQLNNREDACGDSSLHLLLRIIETKLKSFELVWIEQLPDKLIVQSRQPNIAIECESIDMFNVMKSCKEKFSELDFTTYLETSCSLPPSEKVGDGGWVFCSLVGENLIDNDVQDNLLNVLSLPKYKIEQFMKKIVVKLSGEYWIIQFWTPKMVEDRYRLETIDQPYAFSSLAKGLASFRKECTKHHYFVDDEAKEEELGPPGRVFRNEHPEFNLSLFHYSTKEFGLRNYAVHCHLEEYFALPVFDKQEHKCVGVFEFIGIEYDKRCAKDIEEILKVANLSSSCLDMCPRFTTDDILDDIKKALTEVRSAFSLIGKIPQLYLAKVWVPYEKCTSINSNVRYMELAVSTKYWWEGSYRNQVHWISRVQSKKGMIGMVLESENKSCFCRSLSEFSIADQPLALVEREERLDVCFAICLQSSHTGDLLYVLEFFLNPSINDLPSFFNFLLPIFKQELQSFKYSSGKHIGEELVVEVIEFHEANNLAFSELGQLDVFPIKFRRVQYGQTEHQQAVDESMHCISDARQTEQGNTISFDLKKTNRGKRKINLNLSLEDLKPHFGKKLKDVAEELGVGRSTIKRACREYGIERWPGNEKQARNPSLFERERAQHPSSSSSLQLRNTSLHQNVARTNTESTQHAIVQEEAEKVMIRVKHEEDTIKFELCLSLGVRKLFEEVMKRLNLQMGGFKLKYVDEDSEEILIACDDDLQLCPKSQTATGKTCIQLFIPKS